MNFGVSTVSTELRVYYPCLLLVLEVDEGVELGKVEDQDDAAEDGQDTANQLYAWTYYIYKGSKEDKLRNQEVKKSRNKEIEKSRN